MIENHERHLYEMLKILDTPMHLTLSIIPICTTRNMPWGGFPRMPCCAQWRRGSTAKDDIWFDEFLNKLISWDASVVTYPKRLSSFKVSIDGSQGVRDLCIWNIKQKRKQKLVQWRKKKKIFYQGPILIPGIVKGLKSKRFFLYQYVSWILN